MITQCALFRMQKIQEENVNDSENATPSKKRRSLQLPDSYKKEKRKLDLEGKEVYLIRAPADVSIETMYNGLQFLTFSLIWSS